VHNSIAEIKPPQSFDEMDEEEFQNSHLFIIVSKNFQKSSLWFFVIAAYAAFRAPTILNIAMAYCQIGARVL